MYMCICVYVIVYKPLLKIRSFEQTVSFNSPILFQGRGPHLFLWAKLRRKAIVGDVEDGNVIKGPLKWAEMDVYY